MTKKSNAVELVSVFGKIKPCGLNLHGSCSNLHTPLRITCQTVRPASDPGVRHR